MLLSAQALSAKADRPFWRRKCISMGMAAVLSLSAAAAAHADTYPSKTITIVVGFAPGGLIDSIARLVGQKLQTKLGQTVVIENRAGAAGNLAHRRVATAEPDGYTILGATTSLPINESLYPKRGYTADDFKAVSIVATSPEMISAPPDGAKTLKEFIDNARSSTAQFGTAGAGSASYIVTQYFFTRIVKIPTTHIPFQGGAPAVTAAMGNQIPLVATPPAAGAAAPVKAGALRGLAIASEKRMAILPDVPTYGESGYPGFVASAWTGFFLPAKTPDEIAETLNVAINEILKDPEVASRLEQLGFETLNSIRKRPTRCFDRTSANGGAWSKPSISSRIDRIAGGIRDRDALVVTTIPGQSNLSFTHALSACGTSASGTSMVWFRPFAVRVIR
jgi:tripartite-type tricarboxylate transporter receptor subunit TctC